MAQILTLVTIAVLSAVDQIIKSRVISTLAPSGEIIVIKDVFRLSYVENTGAVFGSFQSNAKVLALLTALIILGALVLLMTNRIKNKFLYGCLVLVVSGGIGNLIDRVTRGFVVDYFEPLFVNFFVFNFADCLVTVGAFAMMGYLIFDLIADLRKTKNEKR